MPSFNRYFNNFFGGCQLLAEAYDQHRKRDVRIYLIPGTVDVVGVTDTVDCWVCPTNISPFSVDVKAILDDLQGERKLKLPIRAPGIPGEAGTGKRARIRISSETPATPPIRERKRLLIDPGQPETRIRQRTRLI